MPELIFDIQEGYPSMVNRSMTLSSSDNNKVPVVEKSGYKFLGWHAMDLDYFHFIVSEHTGTKWDADKQQITVYYSDGRTWTPRNIPKLIPIFDVNGKSVKATGYWSDNYPSGVWLNPNNVTVKAVWEDSNKQRVIFNKRGNKSEMCVVLRKEEKGYSFVG